MGIARFVASIDRLDIRASGVVARLGGGKSEGSDGVREGWRTSDVILAGTTRRGPDRIDGDDDNDGEDVETAERGRGRPIDDAVGGGGSDNNGEGVDVADSVGADVNVSHISSSSIGTAEVAGPALAVGEGGGRDEERDDERRGEGERVLGGARGGGAKAGGRVGIKPREDVDPSILPSRLKSPSRAVDDEALRLDPVSDVGISSRKDISDSGMDIGL